MTGLTKEVLDGVIGVGYYVDDAVSFQSDGRLSGGDTRATYRELILSKLGLKIHEGENEVGSTVMVISAPFFEASASTIRELDYVSAALSGDEKNHLIF